MTRLLWLLVIMLLAWMLKLTLDLEQVQTKQMHTFSLSIDQQKQRIDRLNDQYIALNSLINNKTSVAPTVDKNKPEAVASKAEYNAQHLVLDRLQLIQLTIQQQDFNTALAQIQELRLYIDQDKPLSQSLNAALLDALATDQANLVSFVQQQHAQQTVLLEQLHAIEHQIHPQVLDSAEKKWRWSAWFSLSPATQVPDLKNHALHYQYIKLKLLLAQQALNAGQVVFYQTMMKEIAVDVLHYPDDLSKTLAPNINKLSEVSLIAQPKLSALALLQGG